jgi:hypothetical protein
MNDIYIFLIRNDVWIYILCGLGLIWYVSELIRARRLLRRAMFGLERERGETIQRTSLTFILVLSLIVAGVAYVNVEVAPTLPPELLRAPTPTPNIFATPLSSPTPLGTPPSQRAPTLVVAPTVTLPGLPTSPSQPEEDDAEPTDEATPTSTPPPEVVQCSPTANITAPPTGAIASGRVTFFGSAAGDGFASYQLEASGPETGGEWRWLLTDPASEPVIDGILGSVDFSGWALGAYTVRLQVLDEDSDAIGACAIQLNIS